MMLTKKKNPFAIICVRIWHISTSHHQPTTFNRRRRLVQIHQPHFESEEGGSWELIITPPPH